MATTLRVHTLAKELGVPSKAIIDKCQAEGIELKNHMAALSVGLAESIREWFTVGADVTSVEFADHVDVDQVRRTRRKPRSEKGQDGDEVTAEASTCVEEAEAPEAEGETGTVVAAPPEAEEDATPAEVYAAAEVEAPVEGVIEAAPEVVTEPAPTEELPAIAAVEAAPGPEAGVAPPSVAPPTPPPPPEPILPAGPKLVPKPAELKGPQVVRIEAPDEVRAPRPRRPSTAVARGPTTEEATTTSPRRRGGKGRKNEETEAAKVRARSPRRQGTATDVDQRLREWRDQDLLERKERLASVTGHGLQQRRAAERRRQATTQPGGVPGRKELVTITTPITLKEFCSTIGMPFVLLSKKLMEQTGRMWTINQSLDAEQTELLALDLGLQIQVAAAKSPLEKLEEEYNTNERPNLQPRPPVVAMLGHVDHGKTSLLDAVRKTHVAAGEAGGITQHIGAYRIDQGDWHVTFVDTPGHEAFTAMRARGANLTDVVVLVVAADDGVMPQTIEAINHARAANVAIVVALNKIDLPGVDINKVYGELAQQGLAPTEWGGETDVIRTSATTGEGVDDLIAHLSTLSDLLELKADPTVPARATVIEAQMREGRGVAAQVLVEEGTLKPGAYIVCGPGAGRIRALRDDRGKSLKQAGPGTPVEVYGLDEMPSAGDRLYVVRDLARAKEVAEQVGQQRRQASLQKTVKPVSLESLLQGGAAAEVPELNVIIKADVQGSAEVLKKSLGEFPAEKARLNMLHTAVGAVSEADVQLAKASGALIIGFHVVAEDRARQLADQLGVEIRTYRIIYEVIDDLHKALAGLLAPTEREELRGSAEVRQVFRITRLGTIAGCLVTDGVINRNCRARLVRDGRIIVEGASLSSLKRFKDDAREVRAGLECGIKLQDFDDVKPGDVIQAYEVVEVAQEL